MPSQPKQSLSTNPVELLQHLIRFDTTNPPGNERPCIVYIKDVLGDAGIQSTIVGRHPDRPNLIARLKGQGVAPPLLFYGHVDVVSTRDQVWTYPPFEGCIEDDFVWGRGALDMKGGLAMMLSAVIQAHTKKIPLPGDVILAITSDEETLGSYGTAFLVDEHPQLFDGVKYAISEMGGFSLTVAGKRLYPIMIAEKQACWLRAIVFGQGGHGSVPVKGGAMAKAGRLLTLLDERKLPVHVTSSSRMMIDGMASALGGIKGLIVKQLTNPLLVDPILSLLGEQKSLFSPLLHNTVSATGLTGSQTVNVIPNEVEIVMDGRLLPGYGPDDLISEIKALVNGFVDDIEFSIVGFQKGPSEPDMGLYNTLKSILVERDRIGVPFPMVLPGVTDARLMSKLGIQTYGFLPMRLPEEFNIAEKLHGVDERIPVEALAFGTSAMVELLQRFGEAE